MGCNNTYHINCDNQFFVITTRDCTGAITHVERLWRHNVRILPDYKEEVIRIEGLNMKYSPVTTGLSSDQIVTGCENAISANDFGNFNKNCEDFEPSEKFLNLVACLEQCAYGCCGDGGGLDGQPFATILYDQNGINPQLKLSGGTTNPDCLGQFRADVEVKLNGTAVVASFTYFNSIPASIDVNSLQLDDGFYTATITVQDCANLIATDSTSFTLSPLIPPSGTLSYNPTANVLNMSGQSNDPICNGVYDSQLTIQLTGSTVYDETFLNNSLPSSLNLGPTGLNLSEGIYKAILKITDCTGLTTIVEITFEIGFNVNKIPPSASIQFVPSSKSLTFEAVSNDPSCNGDYVATVVIIDEANITRHTLNFSSENVISSISIEELNLPEGRYSAKITVTDCTVPLSASDTTIFTCGRQLLLPYVDIEYDAAGNQLTFDGGTTDPLCESKFEASLVIINLVGQQVYADDYDEITFPDTLPINQINLPNGDPLPDGNYIAQITLTDCTGETVIDSTTFSVSNIFTPPTASIECSMDGVGIVLGGGTNEPTCGGVFTATLEVFTLAGVLVTDKEYTQVDYSPTISFADLELAQGTYRFKITIEDCTGLQDIKEVVCEVTEINPIADIDFDGVDTLTVMGESLDPSCEGVFAAEVVIIDATAQEVFASTYDNTTLPEDTGIDVGPEGLDLQPGLYIATLTVTDCIGTAIDSVTFEIPDLLLPCADIELDTVNNDILMVDVQSKEPSCNGEFNFTITITRQVQTGGDDIIEFIVYSLAGNQDILPRPLDLDPLNLEPGNYIATLTVTDCTEQTATDSVEWVISDTCTLVQYSDSIEDFTDDFEIINNGNGTVTFCFNYDPDGINVNALPPTGLGVTNKTQSSARLTWNSPNSVGLIAYNVRIRKVGTSGWVTQTVSNNVLYLDVNELQRETSYEFQVQAVYEGATSPFSAAFIFITLGNTNPVSGNPDSIFNRWGVTVVADNHNDKSGIYKHLRWYLFQVDLSSGGQTTSAQNLAFDPFYGFGGNVCNSHDGCESGTDTIIGSRFAASEVNLSLQGAAKYLRPPDGGNPRHVATDAHTILGPTNSNNPNSYSQQALMMFQLAARLGSNPIDVNDPRLGVASGNTIKTGLGLVKRIMPWNETYEHWEESGYGRRGYTDLNGVSSNRARGDWHPHEETAMMKACYDRIKEADPNMIVMWPGNVKWDGFRGDGGQWAKIVDAVNQLNGGQIPCDEYCVHIYWNDKYADRTQDYTQAINFSSTGAEPEAHGKLRVFVQDMINRIHQDYPNLLVSITETGYDVDGSPQQVKQINGKTTRQTYGDWTIRMHLAYLATDLTFTIQYSLDHTHAGGGGWLFGSSGVIDGNNDIAEPAWYMTHQFLGVLGNYKFDSVIQEQAGGVWIYKFEDVDDATKKAYVVWNGTATNKITSGYSLQLSAGESNPIQHQLNYNGTSTTVNTLSASGSNTVSITVSETPQIILVSALT